eukprot:TRINITY_DN14595_c0_g1_i3.p1 TRINITY_DN14595_c0_g1~~TRINITY_DN14595_c0_g1_i3.p1  ORF type:complete len:285 (+),score=50.81 TRINITY_DN14595_c0_g1_i3:54-857(+)
MAAPNQFIPKGRAQTELYLIPSANWPIVARAERRVKLLHTWRQQKRYKLNTVEKQDMEKFIRKQSWLSKGTFSGLFFTWWVTGTRNDAGFYKNFGFLSKSATEKLIQIQAAKLQWHVASRVLGCLASTVPFMILLAQAQEEYFEKVVQTMTIYGGFARYVKQQGARMENGEEVERYQYGNVYKDKVETKLSKYSPRSEHLSSEGGFNTAPPEPVPMVQPTVTPHVFHAQQQPILPVFSTTEVPLPQKLRRTDSNPTVLFMDHVFGSA